ncbi:Ankyrin repeat-containing protein ITN1 [Camellia lanceoleosa]|uniref:Ankyrin repeat-containing protein ITN1 n=1 Tax=Camellia lanceoleosa TaxID=1840588 RepID=A0ACC0GDF2_9ERIC|nr:Ankyrin repeat-containing protein ITN1 [Camellia lanceoleosa]
MAISPTNSFIAPPLIISCSRAFKLASDCNSSESSTLLCNFLRQERVQLIDARGNTLLHFLAMYGNLSAFKMLLGDGILTNEDLAKGNKKGDTPLHEAAKFGQKEIVEVLLEYERDLVMVSNNSEETPLFTAALCGKKEVFDLLIKDGRIHSDHYVMARTDGSTVLHAAIMGEYFSLAMSILETFPKLAHKYDSKGRTPLDLLATKPLSFNSGSSYSLVNLGSRPFIPLQLIAIFVYFCIPSMVYGWKHAGDEENQHQNGHDISNLGHLATKLIPGFRFRRILRVCAWLREIDDAKKKHEFALKTAKNKKTKLKNPIVHATENGIIKLVKEILEIFPDAAYSFDKNGKNILHIAVEQKDRVLYDYLKKNVDHKDGMLSDVDNDGNTVLHLAANMGTSPKVVLGHLNQMTWDICWFKRVWYDSPPHFLYHENSNGMTAKELFEINHIDLRDKAEKAFKDMNNGLMLVTALIGTVNYAALFTLPGGYDQDNQSKTYGEPILLIQEDTEDDTSKFLWYISIALFSSLFALVSMLSIQLSRFRSNDFYIALPFRYIVAVMALACSTIFTLTACMQAYILDRISFNSDSYMWPIGILMALVYIDALYLTSYYMFFVIGSSFAYKGQEM